MACHTCIIIKSPAVFVSSRAFYNDCVMDYQAFRKKLDSLNKLSLAALISGIGLKRQDTQILKWWYIDELNINEIAQALTVQRESAYNQLSAARRRLFLITANQQQLLPAEMQHIIKFLAG